MKKLFACLPVVLLLFSYQLSAQYCIPSGVNTGGLFISNANFNLQSVYGYDSGTPAVSEGYADRSGTSAGIATRGVTTYTFSYFIRNCGNRGARNFNVRIYIDWNHDEDFDDAGEIAVHYTGIVGDGNCAGAYNIHAVPIPVTALAGATRMRWALSEGAGVIAEACGGYTGEIEDYSITIPPNVAPVLCPGNEVVLNTLTETQAGNSGVTMKAIFGKMSPINGVVTDPDQDQLPVNSGPGVAFVAASTGNGTWQVWRGGNNWSDLTGVSDNNAFLLNVRNGRIRFNPTGVGTATLTFRAWDKSVAEEGILYDITSTGGSSAFSTETKTISVEVVSAASATGNIQMYMTPFLHTPELTRTSFSPSSGKFTHPVAITPFDYDSEGFDIDMDAANGRLYWTGGEYWSGAYSCNLDGSDKQTLFTDFIYPAGIAFGGGKIFIIDEQALYRADPDGSNREKISGGIGQNPDGNLFTPVDIAYYNGKLYYAAQTGATGPFKLFEANPDGTATVELLTFAHAPFKLDVLDGTVYWTEIDEPNEAAYLRKRAIAGGSVTTLAIEDQNFFYAFRVDPARGKIYIVQAHLSRSSFELRSVPIEGSNIITDEMILEGFYNGLVFPRSMGVLPVNFVNLNAWPSGSQNKVSWKVANQENLKQYIVERSADGRSFSDAGSLAATSGENYNWTDILPFAGKSYYRIRSVDNDGKKLLSATVEVDRAEKNSSITVFPTQIKDDQFTLRLQNVPAGNYQLQLFNNTGQQVYAETVRHSFGTTAQTVYIPAGLPKAIYRVSVTGNGERLVTSLLLQ
ncbi:MAG: GEVED domain-containing protein [Chitinophagaceae bacterium]